MKQPLTATNSSIFHIGLMPATCRRKACPCQNKMSESNRGRSHRAQNGFTPEPREAQNNKQHNLGRLEVLEAAQPSFTRTKTKMKNTPRDALELRTHQNYCKIKQATCPLARAIEASQAICKHAFRRKVSISQLGRLLLPWLFTGRKTSPGSDGVKVTRPDP